MSDSKQINPEKAIGFKTKEVQSAITARDAIIYALGVGYS
jgi:acyl dehydratase